MRSWDGPELAGFSYAAIESAADGGFDLALVVVLTGGLGLGSCRLPEGLEGVAVGEKVGADELA